MRPRAPNCTYTGGPNARTSVKTEPYWNLGRTTIGPAPRKKALIIRAFFIAGAGFEPATFGL